MSRPELFVTLVVGENCDLSALALRSSLEYFGARVNVHWIGRPNDLIDVLSGDYLDNPCDYLILDFHGDEGRLYMTELDSEIYEPDEPRGKFFDYHQVRKYTKLKNINVIANGCTLGDENLAKAFLDSGCKSYMGPNDYIDGNSALMFIIAFMYEVINNKKSQKEAFEIARSIDEETGLYELYLKESDNNGTMRVL